MDPRHQPYAFVHNVLRDAVLADPLMFLWMARLPDAAQKMQNIWRRIGKDVGEDVPCETLGVWVDARPPTCAVVVALPPPVGITECYFAAAFVAVPDEMIAELNEQNPALPAIDPLDRALKVCVGGVSVEERAQWKVPALFFTLEHGENMDGTARTVLCEWHASKDGGPTHANHGDGPPPDRRAFLQAIGELMMQRGADA